MATRICNEIMGRPAGSLAFLAPGTAAWLKRGSWQCKHFLLVIYINHQNWDLTWPSQIGIWPSHFGFWRLNIGFWPKEGVEVLAKKDSWFYHGVPPEDFGRPYQLAIFPGFKYFASQILHRRTHWVGSSFKIIQICWLTNFEPYRPYLIPCKLGRLRPLINGNSRILKWRYCTIFLAIFCWDIPLHRPET